MSFMSAEELRRFMLNIHKDEQTGCWLWTGLIHRFYALFHMKGVKSSQWAHRISHKHFIGPIPKGYQVDHICRNKHCVNPVHLRAVTPKQNAQLAQVRAKSNGTLHLPFDRTKCVVNGCSHLPWRGQYCQKHYTRLLRNGSPTARRKGCDYPRSPLYIHISQSKTPYWVTINKKGDRVGVHRVLMEQVLDRKLKKSEVVHHKDGNGLNNRLSNLEIVDKGKHVVAHMIARTQQNKQPVMVEKEPF